MLSDTATLSRIPQPATAHDAILVSQDEGVVMDGNRVRLLIEDWLPIAALGEESKRERRSMTALPPTYYLHVWWARRPLVASRAAVLASLLPSTADRDKFLHMLGIHGDPIVTRKRIDEAKQTGENLGLDVYGYKRAFNYMPNDVEIDWLHKRSDLVGFADAVVLDPTAGGGSIPYEALRLGVRTIANDLNPVAWLILKATVEFPDRFGVKLLDRYRELAERFETLAATRFENIFPPEPTGVTVDGYLWARTITCPYCGGRVPLSPNWKLNGKGKGVRLVPHIDDPDNRHCTFEIVEKAKDHSSGTVRGGNATCPYPDCTRFIDGDEIKRQAQSGHMGQQLYAIVFKRRVLTGYTKGKNPKPKYRMVRGFRAPRPEDDVESQVQAALDAKRPDWIAGGIIPEEEYPDLTNDERPRHYGMPLWRDMFAPRQLYGHCVSVEVFQEMLRELASGGEMKDVDRAAMTYIAVVIDKVVSYNSVMSRWDVVREAIRGKFDRHDFSFKWSYGEMAPTIAGLGYDWAIEQTGKALKELIELCGHEDASSNGFFPSVNGNGNGHIDIRCDSADSLCLEEASVDCIVMDPPYYDNVMYAELSDFFYVWLKRTAGLLFPEQFALHLTDKDREAVANPARFKGQKGAKSLAGHDYEERMARIFERCRSVLKPSGVMTVMFTHKAANAWDFLANALVRAGFVITASWPINTEAEGSLHIKEKSAARSTIFLVCRPREERPAEADTIYWEEVEPLVVEAVKKRVGEFQEAGIGGVDLYLACFGPALQVFSEKWPLRRGHAVQKRNGNGEHLHGDDPYAVRPEDALDAARREVKRWRMEQLATVKRRHHLDPLTEWFVLAWDTFKAPRFSSDEGLRLARVVGLDFDRQVKNVVCEVKGDDVLLWDSVARATKGKLGAVDGTVMLDALHHAARLGREQNTGAAKTIIEDAGLLDDATLLTTLEVLLNVLPPPAAARRAKKADALLGGAAGDFEALEKLRLFAFTEQVPAPIQRELFPIEVVAADGEAEEDDG